MSIISKMRRQKAVLWRRLAPDKFGRFRFAEPVEIACRWEDVTVEYLNAEGEKYLSQSVVYVDREIAIGDRLKRGEVGSDTPNDPLSITDTFEVKQFSQTPNLRATETLLTAYL